MVDSFSFILHLITAKGSNEERAVTHKGTNLDPKRFLKVSGGEIVKKKISVSAQGIARNEEDFAKLLAAAAVYHIAAGKKTRDGDGLTEEFVVYPDPVYL
jgi:hypothetical protein